MRLGAIKYLDEFLGRIAALLLAPACRLLSRPRSERVAEILVIKFWGLGSVTLSTPLLKQIHAQFPDARINYLTLEDNAELCRLIPYIDTVVTVSIGSFTQFVISYYSALNIIRKLRVDTVIDLEFFAYASAIAGALTFAQRRKGFVHTHRKHDYRKLLYTDRIEFLEAKHTAQNFLNLVNNEDPISFPKFRGVPATSINHNKQFRIVVNINASALAYERRWSLDNFVLLSDFLIQEFNAHLYLTGSAVEVEYVHAFMRKLKNPGSATNLAGALSLAELFLLLRQSRLLITNDSGPLHFASALNVPTVCFFGPETPLRYGSLAQKSLTFYKSLWCSPCMTVSNHKTVNCVNNQECMKQITLEEVKREIVPFILAIGPGAAQSETVNASSTTESSQGL
jgi:ADP-heptose:LPS heptosyltransferase